MTHAELLFPWQVDKARAGDFLTTLNTYWLGHTREMIMIRDIFLYMVRGIVHRVLDFALS